MVRHKLAAPCSVNDPGSDPRMARSRHRELRGRLTPSRGIPFCRAGGVAPARRALELNLPVIRFNKIAKNYYVPIYPVYVVGDNPISREFTLTVDDAICAVPGAGMSPIEKLYVARIVRQRVHQSRRPRGCRAHGGRIRDGRGDPQVERAMRQVQVRADDLARPSTGRWTPGLAIFIAVMLGFIVTLPIAGGESPAAPMLAMFGGAALVGRDRPSPDTEAPRELGGHAVGPRLRRPHRADGLAGHPQPRRVHRGRPVGMYVRDRGAQAAG